MMKLKCKEIEIKWKSERTGDLRYDGPRESEKSGSMRTFFNQMALAQRPESVLDRVACYLVWGHDHNRLPSAKTYLWLIGEIQSGKKVKKPKIISPSPTWNWITNKATSVYPNFCNSLSFWPRKSIDQDLFIQNY